jgi:hypothetical protein
LVDLHDLTVLLPFSSVNMGQSVPFTASLPTGETASSYTFFFGDGTNLTTSASPTASHSYSSPGSYLVYATAQVDGVTHDSVSGIVELSVGGEFCADCSSVPFPIGWIVANTTSTADPSAIIEPGQSVTVSASFENGPGNPSFTTLPPTLATPDGAVVTGLTTTANSVRATVTFPSPGLWTITCSGRTENSTRVEFSNYTWSVYVGHGEALSSRASSDPHPGAFVGYELDPGGAQSEDPAIDYESVGTEPIMNVYQTLIAYNGTDVGPGPSNFVPVLSTCVPGSAQCVGLYGNPMTDGANYTFVIQANASFYDPSTGASWSVYPSDVVFSVARALGFSTLPTPTIHPGWVLAQALLSPGNATWDPIHGAYNNTPEAILGSMSVNDSRQCPPIAIAAEHGCVTFHADGGGHPWPYFLELLADPLGGSVVPCGWFSAGAQGAGIPYWSRGNITGSGDRPCSMPGTGLGVPPDEMPATGWDQWEQLGSGSQDGKYLGNVQWSMVGSGPYYLANYTVGASYGLRASPAYHPNPFCSWTGCPASPGRFPSTVAVTWETTETPGEQALRYGSADFATIPSTEIGLLLQLIQQGKLNAIMQPTLTLGFEAFNMNFSRGAQSLTANPITIKSDFFSYLGMREFFARAYPYQTIESTINTRDGIELSFPSGGAIPEYLSNYYPNNIPWPNSDPCTDASNPACPSYWWAQMQNTSGPYYDPEVAGCTVANPCEFPSIGNIGDPAGDQVAQIWAGSIGRLSGGAIEMQPADIEFGQEINDSRATAGANPMPIAGLGWAPDYPDPTDYVTPFYAANSTYTEGDAVAASLEQPRFATGCAYGAADYADWALMAQIPQRCQGIAYRAMLYGLGVAATDTNLTRRAIEYAQSEEIAYQLCLYVYTGQGNAIFQLAPWWNVNSIDTNPMADGDYVYSALTPLGSS